MFKEPRAIRRLVNRVSVEASFFKKMSAQENLAYAARFYGMTSAETRDKIPHILERVGFPAKRSGESMENLSRGMQQKVALARALLTSPVLLLLDEPTILLCTHDMNEAESLANRVGILHRGDLLCLEPADELKRRYGAETLEEAFFAATGASLEEEEREEDKDDEREVWA